MQGIEAIGPDESVLEVCHDAFADRVQFTITDATDPANNILLTVERDALEQLLQAVRSEAGEAEEDDQ